MPSCKSVYDPREDSTMLERHVRQYAHGKVLDVGTGSGIQAIAAAQSSKVQSVLATDVQKEVIEYCKACIKHRKIRFQHSDLFSNVKGKFDTIIFNPPYLPQELEVMDVALEGGKKGYEVIERFLNEANGFLKQNGMILMVFSSLTKKDKVEGFIRSNLFEFRELERAHIFFEDIHVYRLEKSDFLKRIESRGIKKVRFFTKGHRGFLFTGSYKNKKVAVKAKNPASHAVNRIKNEAACLKKLRRHGIAPKLLLEGEDYFVYLYIDGQFILDYLEKSARGSIRRIIKKIFMQMFLLDRLKIDKEEMHHPVKHVIVSKNRPYLIDFERAHYSSNPKNVTQFCQFIISGPASAILKNKKIDIDMQKVINLAKIYKNSRNIGNFRRIMGAI